MEATVRRYVTEQEFLSWPETHEHFELLDGEIIVTPPPLWHQQRLVGSLYLVLSAWSQGRTDAWTVGLSPCALRFGRDRILEPDLFVLQGTLDDAVRPPILTVPTLCVEVLSSDREYDRRTRRLVYAAAGVREFWAVDPRGAIERFTGADLAERVQVSDTLTSLVLPELTVDVTALMRGGR